MKRIEISQNNPRVLIAVYGTLRTNDYNWSRILKGKAESLGTYTSEPVFTMCTSGGFPIVSEGKNTIEYEVFEIKSNEVLEKLHSLEGCTGIPGDKNNWYDIQPIETPHGRAYIYMQHDYGEGEIIKSGNWFNYTQYA